MRPNARSLSVFQGKGATRDAAKVSAAMEAYEHFCAESACAEVVAPACEVTDAVLPAARSDAVLDARVPIAWIAGRNLVSGDVVRVPLEAVSADHVHPGPTGFGVFVCNSNGLASGNTWAEALLHGLCELVERDALTLWRAASSGHRAGTRIDPGRSADPGVRGFVRAFGAAAIRIEAWDITSDLGVPACLVVLDDADGGPPFLGRFAGSGCHPDPAVALGRALTEAAQSRLTFISGTRDDMAPAAWAGAGWHGSLAALLVGRRPPCDRPPPSRSVATDSTAADATALLARIVPTGPVVAVDLTDPVVGLPCLKVLAPGLEGMSHRAHYRPGRRAAAWR